MMFRPIVELEVPSRPEDMAKRHHNAFVKEALREAMLTHHRRHISKHFTTRNRSRYGHALRNPRYKAFKRRKFGHEVDLVKTGASRDQIVRTTPAIRIGGSAEGGAKGITGQYRLRFAWKGGSGTQQRTRAGVTPAQMLKELARWSEDESREAVENFHKAYWRRVEQYRGGRKRIRMPRR